MPSFQLAREEQLYYRDRLRAARYSALADAEGFGEICFALEALGLRLTGKQATMGAYAKEIRLLAEASPLTSCLPHTSPGFFTRFDALYQTVNVARNDVMHTGAYARNATTAAIELCIGLEDALMQEAQRAREIVADFMVKAPVVVEPWQPVAHVRQLMLMHSFTYLPVFLDEWKLVSELAMAKFLHKSPDRKSLLAVRIDEAAKLGLDLVIATVVNPTDSVNDLLRVAQAGEPQLWLVLRSKNELCGVLSPFELM